MGRWFQEEVAGDRYIFDSELNPVVLGCPQGVPVFVIPGEEEEQAQRACDAHNAAFRVPCDDYEKMKSLEWRCCLYGGIDFKDCEHYRARMEKLKAVAEFGGATGQAGRLTSLGVDNAD